MNELELYSLWCNCATEDADIVEELKSIDGNKDAIKERFYKNLEFGTGGLRGVIGAGTARLNIYTIRKATQGLANYLNEHFTNPSVAVSFDSRIKSTTFAKTACEVLAGNGIKANIYTELMPTPMLSFAVRELKCQAGIMVTASHNPAKYNGYKVYGEDGCQLNLTNSEIVINKINQVDIFKDVKHIDFEEGIKQGLISYIGEDVIENFYKNVIAQGIHVDLVKNSGLKVVYTPLNGTGNKPVRTILNRIGVNDITVVPEQENPDGNFPTCPFPNPEIREALNLGLKLCETVKPDLLLATDPDADRVGIAVPNPNGEYVLFSGNEVGALLFEYICKERIALGTMPKNPVAVKTIVTTDIVNAIAKEYNVELRNVLTGFKFIGEQIGLLETDGQEDRYVFGFEESYGYLAGSYVRDKDAVVASMLICDMTSYYRTKGISLYQARENLYKRYGCYHHSQESFQFEGITGMQKMKDLMAHLREHVPTEIGGLTVTNFEDYIASTSKDMATGTVTTLTLPKSDVLVFKLTDGASVVIRPSGTEPKIKAYYTTIAETQELATNLKNTISDSFKKILGV